MRRNVTLSLCSLLLAALAASAAAQAPAPAAAPQQDFSNVEIKQHQVASNIYYLEGQGGNIGVLVGDDGVLMIDDQFAPLTDKIMTAVKQLSTKPVRLLVNTHVHGDHTGGNENIGKLGINILAHDSVRMRLAKGGNGVAPAPAGALRHSWLRPRVMVASALFWSWKSITFCRLKSVKRSPLMIRKRSSRYFSAYFTAPAVPMSSRGVT